MAAALSSKIATGLPVCGTATPRVARRSVAVAARSGKSAASDLTPGQQCEFLVASNRVPTGGTCFWWWHVVVVLMRAGQNGAEACMLLLEAQ